MPFPKSSTRLNHKLNRNDPEYRQQIRDACKRVITSATNDEETDNIKALMRLLPNS